MFFSENGHTFGGVCQVFFGRKNTEIYTDILEVCGGAKKVNVTGN